MNYLDKGIWTQAFAFPHGINKKSHYLDSACIMTSKYGGIGGLVNEHSMSQVKGSDVWYNDRGTATIYKARWYPCQLGYRYLYSKKVTSASREAFWY